MACRIIRDSQNNIQSVLTPQGNPSQLYSDALAITQNSEQALNIAMVPYTQEYEQVNGESQAEPTLENVLIFMNRRNNENKALTKADIDGLINNTTAIEESTIDELYQSIQPLYVNGVFKISKATLRATNLYSEAEMETILSDQTSQNAIRNIADKIKSQAALNNREEITLAIYETPELVSVSDTSTLIGIQKFRQLNPFTIDQDIRSKVGGIKNREQFENLLGTINESISERYFNDAEYANKFFDTYSSMERMPILEDSQEGLSPKYKNNIKSFTEQALIVGQPANDLVDTIDLLQSTPKAIWVNNGVEIEDLLLRAEDFAAEIGIDIVGFSNQEFTYEEAQSFLNAIQNLAESAEIGNVAEADIQMFADNYNMVFKENLNPQFTALNVRPNNAGKTLAVVNSIKTEQQLFDENSLVRAQDNIYQRVNRQQDLEGLYDYLTDLVQFNPNIIEKKALFPSAYKANGEFSLREAKSVKNYDAIREDIIRYVQQQPFSEELTIYKIAFGHPIEFTEPQINETEWLNRLGTVTRSYEYLTEDFIADFAREYLKEKQNDSNLFEKVYSHFTFNEQGISLKDNDPYSKQEINLWTPQNHSLRQYSAISKTPTLNTLFSYESPTQVINQRDFYLNNPQQLPQKTVQYELSQNNEYLATQNLQDNFINVNGVIWEKARTYKNLSIYQRLPEISNPLYNETGIEVKINTEVNASEFEGLVQTLENITEIEQMYTKKEKASIDENTECR